jgi:hypothetical protein
MSQSLEVLQAQLAALQAAYASGALEVTSEGKRVRYGDADDLLKRIRVIQGEIAAASTGAAGPVAGFATFRRI